MSNNHLLQHRFRHTDEIMLACWLLNAGHFIGLVQEDMCPHWQVFISSWSVLLGLGPSHPGTFNRFLSSWGGYFKHPKVTVEFLRLVGVIALLQSCCHGKVPENKLCPKTQYQQSPHICLPTFLNFYYTLRLFTFSIKSKKKKKKLHHSATNTNRRRDPSFVLFKSLQFIFFHFLFCTFWFS